MDHMDRTTFDGSGVSETPAADSRSTSDPYGPRSLGATTDPGGVPNGSDFFDRPYRSNDLPVPGAPVQMTEGPATAGDTATTGIHAAAAHGVQSTGSSLPHQDRIQAAFGPSHDVSGIQAHVGRSAELEVVEKRLGIASPRLGERFCPNSRPERRKNQITLRAKKFLQRPHCAAWHAERQCPRAEGTAT